VNVLPANATATSPAGEYVLDVDVGQSAAVVGRQVFYNNSALDGSDPAADPRDDAAIATDKQALLPGQPAGFGNSTAYGRGINGIMVDVLGLPEGVTPAAADFEFSVGSGGDPASWALAPDPSAVSVRRGEGANGADRLTLTWPDGAILNQWLRVTVRATANTGLAAADVFYFGNLAGDVNGDRAVNGSDFAILASNFGKSGAGMSFATGDLNADGAVNGSDFAILGGGFGKSLPAVQVPAMVQVVGAVQTAPAARGAPTPVTRRQAPAAAPVNVQPAPRQTPRRRVSSLLPGRVDRLTR
jgi:hypothetical protein